MSQGKFWDKLIQLEAFKKIFVFCRKIAFFVRSLSRVFVLVKNDQIMKSTFFTSLCP